MRYPAQCRHAGQSQTLAGAAGKGIGGRSTTDINLTVLGEPNKLAVRVSEGRNMLEIHRGSHLVPPLRKSSGKSPAQAAPGTSFATRRW